MLTACTAKPSGEVNTAGKTEMIEEFMAEDAAEEAASNVRTEADYTIYIIEDMDTAAESITLYSTASGMILRYPYSLTTRFMDKYGNSISWSNFKPGLAVTIGGTLPDSGTLASVKMAESVFVYEDIDDYILDLEKGMLVVAGEKYHVGGWTVIFSGDQLSTLSSIGQSDTLRIVGKDKDILSIAVTTGHGYIQFVNTSLFNDSIIQIGKEDFVMASEGLRVEVPEGEYDVTAANKGYGSTRKVTVVRNETALVDMEEMKGEGPKYCNLSFQSNVTDAKIYLDNELMAQGTTKQVAYGVHSLRVEATGYDSWSKVLYVNSPEANISLNLTADDASGSSGSSSSSGNSNASESSSTENSSAGSNTSGSSSSSRSTSDENNTAGSSSSSSSSSSRTELSEKAQAEVDYITTMSNMLTNILSN